MRGPTEDLTAEFIAEKRIRESVDNRDVRADRIRKSVGAENTFSSDLSEFEALVLELQLLVDNIWRHCEDEDTRGRTVTLKVKSADFELITRSRTIPKPIENRGELETVTVDLLKILFPVEKVRKSTRSVRFWFGGRRGAWPPQADSPCVMVWLLSEA